LRLTSTISGLFRKNDIKVAATYRLRKDTLQSQNEIIDQRRRKTDVDVKVSALSSESVSFENVIPEITRENPAPKKDWELPRKKLSAILGYIRSAMLPA